MKLTCRSCQASTDTDLTACDGVPIETWWKIRTSLCTPCLQGAGAQRVRAHLHTQLGAGEAVTCPTCDQLAKVYKRTMLRASALAVVFAWRDHGHDPFHMPTLMQQRVPTLAHQGGAATLGSYWGLLRESASLREDGGRAGWWQVTEDGRAYAQGRAIPKYAVTYNGRVLRLEGEPRDVHSALGSEFDLRALMAGL